MGALIALNLFLLYSLIFSGQGFFSYRDQKAKYEELESRIQELDNKNRDLSREIRLLKSDRAHLEKVVRQQMNFLKKNETLYIFPDKAQGTPPGDGQDEGKD